MGFFDLIKKHHTVGAPADGLGKLAAFLVTHVSWRGAKEPADRVAFLVFAHVDANDGVAVIKEEFRQGTGQFGFTHAGGA